jgi:hypothetical protein
VEEPYDAARITRDLLASRLRLHPSHLLLAEAKVAAAPGGGCRFRGGGASRRASHLVDASEVEKGRRVGDNKERRMFLMHVVGTSPQILMWDF